MKIKELDRLNRPVFEPLLTVEDLEHLFKVTPRTLARWCTTGRLPRPVKVGGGNRWKAGDIRKYIESLN